MRKLLTFLIALAAVVATSIAIARSDGIYNPKANSVGSFEGVPDKVSITKSALVAAFEAELKDYFF